MVRLWGKGETVYPRGCGGTNDNPKCYTRRTGLSPRVRGNHPRYHHQQVDTRSIPAGAGEPPRQTPRQSLRQVYPRGCGGTKPILSSNCTCDGLSPRVRGNLNECIMGDRLVGSIPAGAGEPTGSSLTNYQQWVYPRGCGGTPLNNGQRNAMEGLSPRVRGNRLGNSRCQASTRSIPAGAGEPRVRASSSRY